MKLVIDCDPGNGVPGANVDDGLAIALALSADRLVIEAITTVTGNTESTVGYSIADTLLRRAGREDVPLYSGAYSPLMGVDRAWMQHLQRASDPGPVAEIWQDVPKPQMVTPESDKPAAQALGEIVTKSPGEVTVVALGPLTNIALAMRLYPTFARDVGEIVIIGGVFDVDGYVADTNFGFDPEAASIVMRSTAPKRLIPLDVTSQTLLTEGDVSRMDDRDDALSAFLVQTTRPWIAYSRAVRNLPGSWIHDVLAVAVLLDESLISSREYYVDVEVAPGQSRGRSLRWPAESSPGQPKHVVPNIGATQLATAVDNEALVDLIVDTLAKARAGRKATV